MILTRTVGPTEMLVDLADLKAHLRVDHDDEDWLIQGLYDDAISHIDGPRGILGRCIQPQTWRLEVGDGFRDWPVRLPVPGILSVSGEIVGGDDPQPIEVRSQRCGQWVYVELIGQPDGSAAVLFEAATPDDAWGAIRRAIKLLVGHWYENREAVVTGTISTALPLSVTRLLTPLKVWRV